MVAWLVPVAAALAVIGAFTPWFKPQVSATIGGTTRSADAVDDALYSWKEGKLGLVAPIVLVLLAIGVVSLLRGGSNTRFHRGSSSPVANAAKGALIAGVVAIAAVVVTYFLLPSQYTFTDGSRKYSWDEALKLFKSQTGASDTELSQGPQIGFWLTAAAGVVAVVAGILMLVLRSKQSAAPSGQQPPAGYGQQQPPAGYGQQQPPAGYGQQQPPAGYGQQQPPAGYGQQQPPAGYGQQQPPANPPHG
ncbi:hypothetical protein SAMN05443575_1131 [Jatrophihabitans endophyticus]|uniref:Uncharacterized protein n=1 Tax=Jatrophihabitans endophyticus TaxID=1206085 RepID=A0A1M5GCS4_9ACTN|nr:resistance to Congo red protein [Jatrophihabitans endophyticus]SHG01489.1 hypothetical protein SAMN05443575_1131 [Jatrophihabitans endophyticus]